MDTELKAFTEFNTVFDVIQDSIFIVGELDNKRFQYVITNRAHQVNTGITLKNIQGKSPQELIGEEIGGIVAANYRRCLDLKRFVEYEEDLHLPVGRRWWRTRLYPVVINGRRYIIGSSTDISKQKEVEHSLQRLNGILNQAQNLTKVGGWELTVETDEVIWTDEVYSIYELTKEFLPYKPSIMSYFEQGDREVLDESLKKCAVDGTPLDLCCKISTAKGKQKFVRVSGRRVSKKAGRTLVTGVIQDITEQHKKEQELEKIALKLSLAVGSASMGIWDYNVEKKSLEWDELMYLLYGYTPFSVPVSYKTWEQHLHPEDKERAVATLQQALHDGIPLDMEFRIVCPDGQVKFILAHGQPVISPNGKVSRLTGVNFDITRRKKSEIALYKQQHLLAAVAQATDELLQTSDYKMALARSLHILGEALDVSRISVFKSDNSNFCILPDLDWCRNNGLCQKLGSESYNTFSSHFVRDFLPTLEKGQHFVGRCADIVSDELRIILTGQQIHSFVVLPILVKGGLWGFFFIACHADEREWSNEDLTILMAYSASVTSAIHRNLLETDLALSVQTAELANKAKSVFLANMSHEIRTPLNAIIGFSDLMMRSGSQATNQEYLRIVNESAHSLLDLLNDVLDLSKVEAGKIVITHQEVDLFTLAEKVLDTLKSKASEQKIELLLNIDRKSPRFIFGDPVRLRQVLVNLVGNAIKFTPAGEVELSIRLHAKTDEKAFIEVAVRDTGIGIAEEAQARIFEAFVQEDDSTTRKYGGTGLGLTISQNILKLLDSKLTMRSKKNEGSTFSFIIAAQTDSLSFEPPPEPAPIRKALVIDDNAAARRVLGSLLEGFGITVLEAEHGPQAAVIIQEHTDIELLLIDYQLPFLDGFESIAMLRKSGLANMPVVIMSLEPPDTYFLDKCSQLNIQSVLQKPIKFGELKKIILAPVPSYEEKKLIDSLEENNADSLPSFKKGMKVLIAEDNHLNSMLVESVLKDTFADISIFHAENGEQAFSLCKQEKPDIVFMDIQMPIMNGIDAAIAIRNWEAENPPASPVSIIALTAGAFQDAEERCRKAGMDDFLLKPIKPVDIIKKITAIQEPIA